MKGGSTRDYQDRKHAKYRNKNVRSKRKVSVGSKKEKPQKPAPKLEPRAPETRSGKKHPRPNSPPPLPTHLQQLSAQRQREKEDLDFMKHTLKSEGQEEPDEYFDFQEKVEYILDLQEDIMNLHLSAIREDAQMLKRESEIIGNARSNDAEYEIDHYIRDTEEIVRKKLMLYKQIADKIKLAKKALAEEEECSRKMKNFMIY